LAERHGLVSSEHFSVDGTLLEAWASQKSFRPIDGPPPPSDDDPSNRRVNFRGERRTNKTHRSVTDPDARLARKSNNTASILAYQASVLMENRHGLIVETDVRAPAYEAERDAALDMLALLPPCSGRRTLGADKGYDTPEFVENLRNLEITPHLAANPHRYRGRRSAIDRRTTRHAGYESSQRKRKEVEERFGWGKTVGLLRKMRHRGQEKVGWVFTFTSAVCNLVRIRTILAT
jgi:hypothetical protein